MPLFFSTKTTFKCNSLFKPQIKQTQSLHWKFLLNNLFFKNLVNPPPKKNNPKTRTNLPPEKKPQHRTQNGTFVWPEWRESIARSSRSWNRRPRNPPPLNPPRLEVNRGLGGFGRMNPYDHLWDWCIYWSMNGGCFMVFMYVNVGKYMPVPWNVLGMVRINGLFPLYLEMGYYLGL